MHEAGLARTIAATITERGLDPGAVTIRVTGGHGEPDHVLASLRTYLEASLGAGPAAQLVIEIAPVPRLCAGCAGTFTAIDRDSACPSCGGPGIVVPTPEQVELLVADGVPA